MTTLEQAPKTLEVILIDDKKKKKYQAQIDYDKQRKQNDPEYKAKKNEIVRKRNYERYHNDPAYAAKVKEAAKARTKKILEIYKENKEIFKSLGC